MTSKVDTATKSFTAGGALGLHRIVRLSGGVLAYADENDADALGSLNREAFASGDVVSVELFSKQGTMICVASEAIAVGDRVGQNASGKVGSGGGRHVGVALTEATADGDYIEVLVTEDPGITAEIADPGDGEAIPVTHSGHVLLVTAGAETRTLANPEFVGQQLLITMKTDGGNGVITAAGTVNQTGNNTLTFADVGDAILLVAKYSGTSILWTVGFNDGVALTTV